MSQDGPESPSRALAPGTLFTVQFDDGTPAFSAGPHQPLLHAAAAAGLELSSSCRNGSCRTCMCRLVSGSVSYRIQWPGLLPEEKADGWILPCIARAETDLVLKRGSPAKDWRRQELPVV
jgi:ferredoxin